MLSQKELTDIQSRLSPAQFSILHEGVKIRRFTGDDLPKGVVSDDVFNHTIRCYRLALHLDLNTEYKERLLTQMLLHDLPEIASLRALDLDADMTAPEKMADPDKAKQVEELEDHYAGKIFTPEQIELYDGFNKASSYMTGKQDQDIPLPIDTVAKMIDTVDANLTLHRALTDWALTDTYNPTFLLPERSLLFAFKVTPVFLVRFNSLFWYDDESDQGLRKEAVNLMDNQSRQIGSYWSHVINLGKEPPNEIMNYLWTNEQSDSADENVVPLNYL